jgi:TonB family protein
MRNHHMRLPIVPVAFAIFLACVFSSLSIAQTTPIRITQAQADALLVNKVAAEYPALARQARIQGAVTLQAVIGKDGDVKSLNLISGHPLLASSAIAAVKQWHYKPYFSNGEPLDVETEITVSFILSSESTAQGSHLGEVVPPTTTAEQMRLAQIYGSDVPRGQDKTPPQVASSTGTIIVEFSAQGADGYFAVVHPVGAQEGFGFNLYCKKVVNSELWTTDAYKMPWATFTANQPVDPNCKPLKQGGRYRTSPLPIVSPEMKLWWQHSDGPLQLFDVKVIGTLKVSESSSEAGTGVKYSVLDEGGLTNTLSWLEKDTLVQQAQAKEEAQLKLTLAARRQDFRKLGLHRLQSQALVKSILTAQGFAPWQCNTEQTLLVSTGYATTCHAIRHFGQPDQDNVVLTFVNIIHQHRDPDTGLTKTDGAERLLILAVYAKETSSEDEDVSFGDDNKPF